MLHGRELRRRDQGWADVEVADNLQLHSDVEPARQRVGNSRYEAIQVGVQAMRGRMGTIVCDHKLDEAGQESPVHEMRPKFGWQAAGAANAGRRSGSGSAAPRDRGSAESTANGAASATGAAAAPRAAATPRDGRHGTHFHAEREA